jgi:hypothetical protein
MARRVDYFQLLTVQIENFSSLKDNIHHLPIQIHVSPMKVQGTVKIAPDLIHAPHMIIVMVGQQDARRLQLMFLKEGDKSFRMIPRIYDKASPSVFNI